MTAAARKARNAAYLSRFTFGMGVAASIAANVIASKHTPIGMAVGLWIPTAFLLSMAMLENVAVKGRAGQARRIAMGVIVLIAGWTSYWHLVEVAQMGGADAFTAHTLPATVDVMMALASAGMKRKPATAPAKRRPAAKKAAPVAKSPAKLQAV
jgi:hypothetical protein